MHWAFIKFKNCSLKDTITKMTNVTDWKKVFTIHISDRGLDSRIRKECHKSMKRKTHKAQLERHAGKYMSGQQSHAKVPITGHRGNATSSHNDAALPAQQTGSNGDGQRTIRTKVELRKPTHIASEALSGRTAYNFRRFLIKLNTSHPVTDQSTLQVLFPR